MKLILFALLLATGQVQAASFDGQIDSWKQEPGHFTHAEENFKEAFKRVRENYADATVTDEDLYRGATAGMLAALNSGKPHEDWNALLSPRQLEDFQIEKTGRLTGLGITLEYEEKTGYAHVLAVLPDSGALKAGMKKGDVILTVNGEHFRGRGLNDMVALIRGPAGQTVHLKVLRDERVVEVKAIRQPLVLQQVAVRLVNPTTALLSIGFFTAGTTRLIEEGLRKIDSKNLKRLIIDLRENGGGTFDDAILSAGLFLPQGATIAKSVARGGATESYKAKNAAWKPEVEIVILANQETASGAELMTAALREGRHAYVIGMPTQGKWNVQSVENLPNKFAIKYSAMSFQSPSGKSYQGDGLKPDLQIAGGLRNELSELEAEQDINQRLTKDAPLKAAAELAPRKL